MSEEKKPWFHEGLRFGCTGCGGCCTGSPGYVWISEEEAQAMASHLQIGYEEFLKRYTRRVGNRMALLEDRKNYDCVFLKENRCAIYSARPTQCRTFPWWKENLTSEHEWQETARRCEGIDHEDAPLISAEEILSHLD